MIDLRLRNINLNLLVNNLSQSHPLIESQPLAKTKQLGLVITKKILYAYYFIGSKYKHGKAFFYQTHCHSTLALNVDVSAVHLPSNRIHRGLNTPLKKWNLGNFKKAKNLHSYSNTYIHSNLDIANKFIFRPFLFTISNNSLYQI